MQLTEIFVLEEVEILPSSVFVGHRYVQHKGSEWRGEHCFRYRSYLNPENHELPDARASAYGNRTVFNSKEAAVSLQRGLDRQEEDSDGGAVKEDGSIRGSDNEQSE